MWMIVSSLYLCLHSVISWMVQCRSWKSCLLLLLRLPDVLLWVCVVFKYLFDKIQCFLSWENISSRCCETVLQQSIASFHSLEKGMNYMDFVG